MLTWQCLPFAELDNQSLYAWLMLRDRVFVVEQACIYQEADGLDPHCLHLLGYRDGELVAGLRIVPPGLKGPEAAIGRVVLAPQARGGGLGRSLMAQGIAHTRTRFPGCVIRIAAQCYLTAFYRSLGFEPCGEPYDEDGIAHIDMRLDQESSTA